MTEVEGTGSGPTARPAPGAVGGFRSGQAVAELSRTGLAVVPLLVYLVTALSTGAGVTRTVAGCLCLVFLVATAGALNDLADVDADRIGDKAGRPLAAGRLTVRQARLFAWLMGAAALVATLPLRQPASAAIVIGAGVGAWLYSARPVRLKARSFLGTIDLAAAYLAVPLLLGLAQSDHPVPGWSTALVTLGLVVCAQGVMWHKDVRDVLADAATRTVTPVVRHGADRLARWSVPLVVVGAVPVMVGTGGTSIVTWIALAGLVTAVGLTVRPPAGVRWAHHARWAMAILAAASGAAVAAAS